MARPIVSALLLGLCLGSGALTPPAWAGAPGNAWSDLGQALPGTHGAPVLTGSGPFVASTTLALQLVGALAQSTAFFVLGLGQIDQPFKGGVLVPTPDLMLTLPTQGSAGVPASLSIAGTVPVGLPHGSQVFVQCWVADAAAPAGFAASNALLGTAVQLHDHLSAAFDALLQTAAPAAQSKPIYTAQDFGTQTYVRNPDCWAASIDLTGLSPWNGTGANTRAGTLVSPRHIVFAKHFPISTSPGSNTIVFVTADDVTVTRQVVGVAYPGGDTAVGVLDADVPPGIGFFKVLPKGWAQYLWEQAGLPMLHLDQEEQALVREWNFLSNKQVNHTGGSGPLRFPFSEGLIGGDSGNPAFVLVDGEALLVLTHFTATAGPFYTKFMDEVNAAMTALGGGYQLTPFDLAGWLEP